MSHADADGHRPPRPSLYVHVPFCRTVCGYCEFAVSPRAQAPSADLSAAIVAEAALRSALPRAFSSILIGGGTPSALPPDEFDALLNAVAALTSPVGRTVEGAREWTVECNPEDVDARLVSAARTAGVTRLSIGVQSFDGSVLAGIQRTHDAATARSSLELATASGLAVSLDLLCGVGGRSRAAWLEDLESAITLGVDHVSIYALGSDAGADAADRVPSELAAATAALGAAGLERYDISNFARAGQRCVQHLGVKRGGDTVGLGPAAASRAGAVRRMNLRSWGAYVAAVSRGRDPVARTETATPTDGALDDLLLALHLSEGASLREVETRWHLPPGRQLVRCIDALLAEGSLVSSGDGSLRLSRAALNDADAPLARVVACGWA